MALNLIRVVLKDSPIRSSMGYTVRWYFCAIEEYKLII
jgi:hypothetical protein